ncbi:MAG: lysylphosphatidylglycerol synthase transmembrane domain-containing protein, partial [Anaerolineales bacterium]
MKSSVGSRSTTILKWFGSLLSVGLIIYLLVQQGWQEIGQALAQIPLWGFAVSVLLMIVSRFAVSNRWYALLRATDEDVNWAQSVRLTFAGLFATNFLPTTIGGDIVRLG